MHDRIPSGEFRHDPRKTGNGQKPAIVYFDDGDGKKWDVDHADPHVGYLFIRDDEHGTHIFPWHTIYGVERRYDDA